MDFTPRVSNHNKIKIRLFAILREAVGEKEITVTVPSGVTVSYLSDEILKKYPQLKLHKKNYIISVNCKIEPSNTIISSSDEIALLPPVSGG